jgi:hypothetical protein
MYGAGIKMFRQNSTSVREVSRHLDSDTDPGFILCSSPNLFLVLIA